MTEEAKASAEGEGAEATAAVDHNAEQTGGQETGQRDHNAEQTAGEDPTSDAGRETASDGDAE